MMTYLSALPHSEWISQKLTIDLNGQITTGSLTFINDILLQRYPAVGVLADGSSERWIATYHDPPSTDWNSRGWRWIKTFADNNNPITGQSSVVETTDVPADVAANRGFINAYLFYID